MTGQAGNLEGGDSRGSDIAAAIPLSSPRSEEVCFTTVLKEDAVTYQLREKNK